jgi:hypothetical protein
MQDVDLLALDDWAETVATLRASGYAELERADHAWAFRDSHGDDVVELHHSVTSCPGLFPHDAPALWSARRVASGQVPWRPAAEDLVVQLCLHAAFQHGLDLRLGQWLDLRRALEREPLSPELLRDRARRAHAWPAVTLALAATETIVGAPPNLDLSLERGVSAERIRTLTAWAAEFGCSEPPELARVRWAVCEGRRQRLLRLTLAPPFPDAGAGGRGRGWPARLVRLARLASSALAGLGRRLVRRRRQLVRSSIP